MFSDFAPFERDPETVRMEERDREREHTTLTQRVNEIIQQKDLRELTSDYLNRSTYYVDPVTQFIWEVKWGTSSTPFRKPSWEVTKHLAELNHLTTAPETYVTQRESLFGF